MLMFLLRGNKTIWIVEKGQWVKEGYGAGPAVKRRDTGWSTGWEKELFFLDL
jgi:hypothetical protein